MRIGLKQIVLVLDGIEWNMTSIHLKVNRFTFLHNYHRVDLNRQYILLHCFSHSSISPGKLKFYWKKKQQRRSARRIQEKPFNIFSNNWRELIFANLANPIFYTMTKYLSGTMESVRFAKTSSQQKRSRWRHCVLRHWYFTEAAIRGVI